jgi:hypothetical protein
MNAAAISAKQTPANGRPTRAHAARDGGKRRGGVWNTMEERREPRIFGETSKVAFWACNPLKFHKTAKAFFGKAWSKTR